MNPRPALIFALVAMFWCGIAQAHQINLTNARITINPDRTVDVELAMKGSDVDRAVGVKVFDEHTGLVRPDALAAAASAVAAYGSTHAVVLGEDGTLCQPGMGVVSPDQDGVTIRTQWSCTAVAGRLRYRSTVLTDVAPDARQVVLIGSAGKNPAQDLLDASRTRSRSPKCRGKPSFRSSGATWRRGWSTSSSATTTSPS